ncbi:hypothetical protein FKM82_027059 [Ascaphus truei]
MAESKSGPAGGGGATSSTVTTESKAEPRHVLMQGQVVMVL